jgi:DNA mismatch endonuclease (patch repair protein)
MSRIRGRDTAPEMIVRRFLHARGLRFRLHQRVAAARPDMVFPSRRAAVEVHGCFFHRHPDPACPLTRTPKSRTDFWEAKFAENISRDTRNRDALAAAGWHLFEVWECQVRDADQLAAVADGIRNLPTVGRPAKPRP